MHVCVIMHNGVILFYPVQMTVLSLGAILKEYSEKLSSQALENNFRLIGYKVLCYFAAQLVIHLRDSLIIKTNHMYFLTEIVMVSSF